MILKALNLQKKTPKPARLSFWPFVDLLTIGLSFYVFSSKFVIAPGVSIELPELEEVQVAIASSYDVLTVNEVEGEEMIIFQGRRLDLETFANYLAESGDIDDDATMLVRSDSTVSLRTLTRVSEIISKAGYRRIQLATEKRHSNQPPFK